MAKSIWKGFKKAAMSNMKYLSRFLVLGLFIFCSGCGLVSMMGTPTDYEKKIPAEYNLAKEYKQAKEKGLKILVLVYEPGWLDITTDLRYYVTDAVIKEFTRKTKIPDSAFISYSALTRFRMSKEDFSQLSPVEVGKALGADMVLFIAIENFKLEDLEQSGFYKGFLSTKGSLYSVDSGTKVWPQSEENRSVKVGFESGGRGQEVAVRRLANTVAFCNARYLYDCIKNQFKTSDERSSAGWQSWE